ncbi:hypothetical protein C8R43DRAFT_1228807 [Mycena crocata]|nr:hypothetical protein C8R43DRAFT_1228807 [Mycena crocata]
MSPNRVYLISGANRGIGYQLAAAIAARPDTTVFAGTRNPDAQALKDLAAQHPNVHPLKLTSGDVTDNADAITEIERIAGRLDIVIANAGVIGNYWGPLATTPLSEFRNHWEVNTLGTIVLFQATHRLLLASPTNAPIFAYISSVASSMGHHLPIQASPYGSSKAASNWLVQSMHAENPTLTAFAIHPGWVGTEMGTTCATACGLPRAPHEMEDTIKGVVSKIDGATREANGGRFLNFQATTGGIWDVNAEEIPCSPDMAAEILPVELEREIFEMTAHSRPMSIPTLMLVAFRVKTWVEPLLYQTILFAVRTSRIIEGYPTPRRETYMPLLRSRAGSLLLESIHHLFLGYCSTSVMISDANWLLQSCSRIKNLVINVPICDLELTTVALPELKHLYCDTILLFSTSMDFPCSFPNITHLNLFGEISNIKLCQRLTGLPRLSHLSFDGIDNYYDGFDVTLLLRRCLDMCKSLQVLVLLNLISKHDGTALPQDPRFVQIDGVEYAQDWQMGYILELTKTCSRNGAAAKFLARLCSLNKSYR